MTASVADQPRWASSPGVTIVSLLHERDLTLEDLADATQLSDPDTRRLVSGELMMSPEVAEALHRLVGGSAQFWINRASQFHTSMDWVDADRLATGLPLKELRSFGWVADADDWISEAQSALQYFGVRDAAEWRERWSQVFGGAQYRASQTFEPNELAVAAWMRQVEKTAESIRINAWDPFRFRQALESARSLTKQRDPQRFYPELQSSMAAAGVAVVIARPPAGCAISGAAFKTSNGVPVIGLTARHLSDDHLWFTFFHEAGHVANGDLETPVLDDLDEPVASAMEAAANSFAHEVLLRGGKLSEPNRNIGYRQVSKLASRLDIAPGVIVGQLHHAGSVPHQNLNRLLRRYAWDGTSLIVNR